MEYKVESTELTDIADAIREKSGSQDALTFPDEFVSEIRSIPTGSTSIVADEYDDQSTYDVGDYVVYDDALYKCNTAITTAEEWTSAHWDEVTVMEEVETKADTDGMYEDMSVGNLISTQFVENKEPYLFRRTGNGKNIDGSEKALIDKIIGGTVAWNQLVQNGNFADTSGWVPRANSSLSVSNNIGTVTVTSTPTSFTEIGLATILSDIIQGHKYFIRADAKPSRALQLSIFLTNSQTAKYIFTTVANSWNKLESICSASDSAFFNLNGGQDYSSWQQGDTIEYRNVQVVDLTSLFGSAEIADYVYSLEQTIAGAGVAWLRNHGFIDGSYRAYDSGSLQSVKTSEHRTVGFNQWDEETESGYINSDGSMGTSSTALRSKNFCECLPNTIYHFRKPSTYETTPNICWYDSNKTFISRSVTAEFPNISSPSNARYFKLSMWNYGAVYNHDICINISDASKNGQYEPYEVHSYPLDPNLELRGLFKLDANNNLYADGDVYESSGEVSRKYGTVDLGTLNWSYDGTWWQTVLSDVFRFTTRSADLIAIGWVGDITAIAGSEKKMLTVNGALYFYTSDSTNSPTGILIYPKETPTTETAQPYASPQVVNPLGTEEYIDTRGVPVPVGHETKYMANLREKIEDLPWDLSMIAPIENGATASQAYSTGQYFLKDNQFCKALTSIASGATFTLNTNYAVTTVANELYTALHS